MPPRSSHATRLKVRPRPASHSELLWPCYWGDSPDERTLWLALGFIEGAYHLCEQMVKDEFSRQYRSSRVLLHLTHHAIELFVKGAIMAATHEPPRLTHRLEELIALYERIYPAAEFHFSVPFELNDERNQQELFPAVALPPIAVAESFRYATSVDGSCFNDTEPFDPESYLEQLGELYTKFNRLFFRLRELYGRSYGPC
jgi:hypothetical protein